MKMWLARDRVDECAYYPCAYYSLSRQKPELEGEAWYGEEPQWRADDSHSFIPALWHRAGGLRLKPGEGPVRVDVQVVVKRIKA